MELFSGIDLATISFVSLATFGAVAAINFWRKQNTQVNFLLSVVFALIFSFVPADLGSIILNKIKDAIAIALSLNGAYQFGSKIAEKVSANRQ